MVKSLVSSIALVVALIGTPATAAEPAPVSVVEFENALREGLGISAEHAISYRDEKGNALTPAQFLQRQHAGVALDMKRDDAARTVVLRIAAKSADELAAEKIARLPAFELTDLSGRHIRNTDLAGRPTLINFFFETCVPCIKEAPMLNAYRRKHGDRNYLAVTGDAAEDARRFVAQRSFEWPVAFESHAFIKDMKVAGFPTYILVAADGRILGRGSGMDVNLLDDPVAALAHFEEWVDARLAP